MGQTQRRDRKYVFEVHMALDVHDFVHRTPTKVKCLLHFYFSEKGLFQRRGTLPKGVMLKLKKRCYAKKGGLPKAMAESK